MRRWSAFILIGALGFLVQIVALAALTSLAHWGWLPATLASVELAVLHNFFWHERWTWRDPSASLAERGQRDCSASLSGERLLRFHLSNGVVSIAGNTALMAAFVGGLGLPLVPANGLAVGAMSLVNFVMADRWVFRRTRRSGLSSQPLVLFLLLLLPPSAFASPPAETLAAWERYVTATEARLDPRRTTLITATACQRADEAIAASGEIIHVPAGTISDWCGAVFIPGMTPDRLLNGLQHPGTPPPQEDVVSSRVIGRDADSLRVAIRLTRHAIVTVSYDTEHEMRFRRLTPRLATAGSVATRIEQVGGGDHGFLWRLHSYWRYDETGGGVLVELRSLTLSRSVPVMVRPIAAPLVNRVARESMVRTLDALRRFYTR